MATNVEIKKQGTENAMGMIRRFTKRVQGAGILRRARAIRYNQRNESKFTKKAQALNRMEKRAEYEKLVKLGKIDPNARRGKRRR